MQGRTGGDGDRGEERRAPEALPGMAAFADAFKPARRLLVGGDGIAVEEFLARPVEHWVKADERRRLHRRPARRAARHRAVRRARLADGVGDGGDVRRQAARSAARPRQGITCRQAISL